MKLGGTVLSHVRLLFDDWQSDARYRDLPLAAQAVFANLVMASYSRGGSLPATRKVLVNASLGTESQFDEFFPMLTSGDRPLFQRDADGRWFNSKAREEYARALALHKRGKAGANAKWGADTGSDCPTSEATVAQASLPGSDAWGDACPDAKPDAKQHGNPEPRTQREEPRRTEETAPAVSADAAPASPSPFEQTWKPWLRVKRPGDQKAAARRAFTNATARLKRTGRFPTAQAAGEWLRDRIIGGVDAVESLGAAGEVPYLGTWLNDCRYEHDGDGFTEKILGGRAAREQERTRNEMAPRTTRNITAARNWEARG